MKSRTTLILLVVALALGGLVALDYQKGTTTDEAVAKRKRLIAIDRAEITRIELSRTNETIVLTKTNNHWQLNQPVDYPADYSAVVGLLDELQFADRQRTLSEDELREMNPAALGLEPAAFVVTVTGKDGPVTVRLGGPTPTGQAVYAQVAGQKTVALLERAVVQRLDRTHHDLRDRTVLPAMAATVSRLELKSTGLVVELTRSTTSASGESVWTLVQPLATRADQTAVGELLSALGSVRVVAFVSDDPKDLRAYQLDEPVREISLWNGAGDGGRTLLIGQSPTNDPAHVYAKLRDRDTIFTLPVDALNKLAVTGNDLRDRAIVVADPAAVHGLELQRGGERLALERTATGWSLVAPVRRPADPDAVAALLTALEEVRAAAFVADVPVDLEPYGLAVPGALITLKGATTNTLAQLLLGGVSATNGWHFAKLAGEPFVYGVSTTLVARLPAQPQALYARRLAALSPPQITRLVVEQAGQKIALDRGPDQHWKLVEPATGVLDADGVRALVETMAELRAEEFLPVTAEQTAACGLERPALVITATTADRNYVLKVGFTEDAERYCAWWNDPESIFTLSAAAVQTLRKSVLASPPVAPPPGS